MSNSYFANRKSSKEKSQPFVRTWMVVAVAIILVILAMGYGTHVIHNTLVVKPEQIYEEAFETPISSISELTGDGKLGGFYDIWIRFKYAGGAILKEQPQFETKRPSQALHWFKDKFPDDKSLSETKHLSLLWRSSSEVTKVTNQWLLYNQATATYYYRAWGYK